MNNMFLAEGLGLKPAFAPVDGAVAQNGARIKMDKGNRVAIVIALGTSLASTVIATLRQHDAASAGNSKDLSVANAYYVKAGTATKFTKVVPTSEAAAFDVSTQFSLVGGLLVLEVEAAQLDINNGFAWFSVNLSATGTAKLVSGTYFVTEAFKRSMHEIDL